MRALLAREDIPPHAVNVELHLLDRDIVPLLDLESTLVNSIFKYQPDFLDNRPSSREVIRRGVRYRERDAVVVGRVVALVGTRVGRVRIGCTRDREHRGDYRPAYDSVYSRHF